MKLLVTGGAGYIGTHTCLALLEAGHEPVVLDNLVNGSAAAVGRVAALAGRPVELVEGDTRDASALRTLFARHRFDAVIHFAGLKAVGESVAQPARYYDNNVTGTLRLVEAMEAAGVRRLIFSSSATVYGEAGNPPFGEEHPLGPTNPYGRTKWMVEQILDDLCVSDPRWEVVLLRYFNPAGAHESGRIGENPHGIPNNLMPLVTRVAARRQPRLEVLGTDYATPDGSGVRDYIHVMDLAEGHVAALRGFPRSRGHAAVINLGTGKGHSVLEVIRTFEAVNGVPIAFAPAARRPGDVAISFADASRAREWLGWQARRDLAAMCRDAWRWQSANPDGYGEQSRAGGEDRLLQSVLQPR
jgi:UDP-glucose 4-epimerase